MATIHPYRVHKVTQVFTRQSGDLRIVLDSEEIVKVPKDDPHWVIWKDIGVDFLVAITCDRSRDIVIDVEVWSTPLDLD